MESPELHKLNAAHKSVSINVNVRAWVHRVDVCDLELNRLQQFLFKLQVRIARPFVSKLSGTRETLHMQRTFR